MKLTVTCQTCGKILSVVEKDNFSNEDISMYQQSVSCDTLQGVGEDDDGNPVNIYDGNSNIQTTKTQ